MFNHRTLMIFGLSLLVVPFLSGSTINYAYAHSNLNSEDQTIGNYELQVATDPEIPVVDHPFKLSFRVLDHKSASDIMKSFDTTQSEVDHFRMAVRMYYNDNLVGTIPVQNIKGGEWSTPYTFHETGNHIMSVDLYDVGPNGKPLNYTFNITVLDVLGDIFPFIISSGGIACFVILGWVFLASRRKVKSKH